MNSREHQMIEYIISEVERQEDFWPGSVRGFANALAYAQEMGQQIPPLIDEETVLSLAKYVHPAKNRRGYRKTEVSFSNLTVAVKWNHIPAAVRHMLEAFRDGRMSADELYQEFLTVHPFVDGNGRVASLLWNLASGNIHWPVTPPMYKRRQEDKGEVTDGAL